MLKYLLYIVFCYLLTINPIETIAQDTTYIFASGTEKLILFKDGKYHLRNFFANEFIGGYKVSRGTYQFIKDSLALKSNQYYPRPTTQIIDTFKGNPTISLIVMDEKHKKRALKINLDSSMVIVNFLPVDVKDTFKTITYNYKTFNFGFPSQNPSYLFYLPSSKTKRPKLYFYEPSLKILKEDVIYFKAEKDMKDEKVVKLIGEQKTYFAE